MAKLEINADELRPLIQAVVNEVLPTKEAQDARLGDRLAYPEAEAASLLGVAKHVLRDCRLRGEIAGFRIGRGIHYERDELKRFMNVQSRKN